MTQGFGLGPEPTATFLPRSDGSARSVGALLALSARRAGGRRAVSALTSLLLLSGVGLFAFAAATYVFNLYSNRSVQLKLAAPGLKEPYDLLHVQLCCG